MSVSGNMVNNSRQTVILDTLKDTWELLLDRNQADSNISVVDEFNDVLQRIGEKHQAWLQAIYEKEDPEHDPILGDYGEVLATPLFHFENEISRYACFGDQSLGLATQHKLDDSGFQILECGGDYSWEVPK